MILKAKILHKNRKSLSSRKYNFLNNEKISVAHFLLFLSPTDSYISQCEEKVGKHILGCIYSFSNSDGTKRKMTELS